MMTTTLPTTTERRALLAALNRCIEATKNAEKGFATAAGDVRDAELRKAFELRSKERASYGLGLQRAVSELGGSPENSGTIGGTLHRAWLETRLAIEGASDKTVLTECARGERACLAVFDMLLLLAGTNHTLPHSLRVMIAKQQAAIRASLEDLLKRLGVA